MDTLGDLRASLGVRPVRVREGAAAPEAPAWAPPTLAQEIHSKFSGKTQPESRQLVAILGAVSEVLKAQGLEVTPTAMFAALMASLEKPETLASGEVLAAMLHLLSLVLARVPNAILRSKFGAGSALLCSILEAKQADTAVAKNAVPCLGQLLAAFNPADCPSAVRPLNLLLSLCLDGRAKVRRAAQSAIGDVFAALQAAPPGALAQASEAVLKLCQRVLPGPEAAAHAAAAAPSKKRAAAEEAIAAAVADALHLLGALKTWLPVVSGPAAAAACDLLLKLLPLRQPLLSRHTAEALTALCSAPGAHLGAKGLSELLGAVLGAEQLWDRRGDSATTLAATRLVEDGLCRLAAQDASLCASRLPRAFHTLVPQLAAEHEPVRFAAGACLKNVINECVDEAAVAAALAGGSGSGKAAPPLLSVLACLEGSLGAHYQEAWDACLPVCAEMIEKLGAGGAPLAAGLLERIGELCAGGDEAAGEEQPVDDALLLAAQDALGAALRSLGPETVLATLPLNLQEGLAGAGEARTWLLPLLRMHVRGARLGYWGKVLLPLARELGSRAAAAASDPARGREAQVCGALEAQLWATLPSFASWAEDTPEALKLYSKPLAAAFEKRADLRVTICAALRRVCTQNRAALAAAGQPVGQADPCAAAGGEEGGSPEEQAHLEVPDSYTAEMAQEAVVALRSLAKNWVPLLLNTYLVTPQGQRGQVESAVSAYACCCDAAAAATFFRAAITKLIKVTQQAQTGELGPQAVMEGGDTDSERRATFLELALALAGGLDAGALDTLYKAAKPGMQEKEPAVQKKCYKVLAYLCESRPDWFEPRFAEVVETLTAASANSVSAAKRNRLRCLRTTVLAAARPGGPRLEGGEDDGGREEATKQMAASMVSEIILCVKERNKATRATAFELLVQIAHAMHDADPPPRGALNFDTQMGEENAPPVHRGGLHELFSMVLGGLVGATPHMISASVMALARLLYEFAPVLAGLVPDLLPAVLLLLRTKAREVIKSVLGFIKVVSLRLPSDDVAAFLPQVLEGILLWAEDSKNKFRAKVRWIVEKLAKRCGFEAVAAHMPEEHAKLLTHIRKENNRVQRRRSEAGSQMDVDEGDEVRSRKSRAETAAARTARGSEWDEAVFSDSEGSGGERTARTARTRVTEGGRSKAQRSARPSGDGSRLVASRAGADPVDLLDARATRQLAGQGGGAKAARAAAKAAAHGEEDIQFTTNAAGRLVINDEKKKRKRADDGWDSEDSDFEDLKGFERSGLSLALRGAKSVALAPTIAASLAGRTLGGRTAGGQTAGGRSAGGKSVGGASVASHGARSARHAKGAQHSGDRFAAKKKGTGGDVKGSAKVEPYAYWPLDRRLMNRRAQKSRGAKQGLDKIVAAAKAGAAKGHKAKRQRASK
ncbi:ARM repeat superfamily [Micractinium conductrix]|uniref:ARM repeat superfamily n=1 Tax=Micractinium conductrix TaxID=554055 RepID=A0A2P6VJG5_9CHLO|nr:ARM repeat superfamily [Micractinium conductrix]|eukprot:PSC74246.1 ARM repeat superfamily [Micractinium conductrix]